MGRRGWQHVDVPSGWIQVIRGPRERKTPDTIRAEASNASQPVAGGHQQFGRWRRRSQEGSYTRARSKKLEAEQAVAEAKEEKEYDLRELPLAESRFERLQAEERVPTSCPAACNR